MEERLNDKIREIEKYLEELEQVKLPDYERYETDFKTRALYERYFERIMEALTDLAFLFIMQQSIKPPEKENEVFDVLLKNKIISEDLCKKLKDARGMRNIISHEYGEVDNKLVFESI